MKSLFAFIGTATFSTLALATITTKQIAQTELDTSKMETVPVKVLLDYQNKGYTGILDLGTYTKIDEKAQKDYFNRYDGSVDEKEMNMACTAYFKEINKNGKKSVLMGRNMDLPNSPYPGYLFTMAVPGKYKSINISYLGGGQETFQQIAREGKMIKDMYNHLNLHVTDAINEKGLVLEINMRDATDKIQLTGTNPGKPRYPSLLLVRYFADNAATIEEALKSLDNIDVFGPTKTTNWHFALAMMDATGRYGVLEFIDNKPVWHEKAKGQTNFWIDKEAYARSDDNQGMGRFERMLSLDKTISDIPSMLKAMEQVFYSQLFGIEADKMTFDSRSEQSGADVAHDLALIQSWQKDYGIQINPQELKQVQKLAKNHPEPLKTTFCMAEENRKDIDAFTNLITHSLAQLPPAVKQLTGLQEVSTISYAADNQEKAFYVRFFEQPELYHYSFDGFEKINLSHAK